jgi:arsenate reductase
MDADKANAISSSQSAFIGGSWFRVLSSLLEGRGQMKRILVLCTGNSARSQMGEGLFREAGRGAYEVESAGTKATRVRPEAITVMKELGIDISDHRSKSVDEFTGQPFDYVVTVCDNARDHCPVFPGRAERIHWSFEDPAAVEGSEEQRLAAFRRIRDEIRAKVNEFAESHRD